MKLRTQMARLKRKLFKKPFLKDKRYPPYWFDQVFGNSEMFLVQIGSNDGKTGDPLNQLLHKNKNWKALFVEPVPYLFERLKGNYSDPTRFSFANVAINEGGLLTFYWMDPRAKNDFDDLPFWYDQLGSFDKRHIITELGERMEPYILSRELEGMSLPDLLTKNKVEKLDILHIDTEGYDWKILSQLDLNAYNPKFILYESNHLSEQELASSYAFLHERYELFDAGIDVLAVHKTALTEYLPRLKQNMKTIRTS